MAYTPQRTCFELRAALEDLRFTQRYLAELTGVSTTGVNRWMRGDVETPQYVWNILLLARALIGTGNADKLRELSSARYRWPIEEHHVKRKETWGRDQLLRRHARNSSEIYLVRKFYPGD